MTMTAEEGKDEILRALNGLREALEQAPDRDISEREAFTVTHLMSAVQWICVGLEAVASKEKAIRAAVAAQKERDAELVAKMPLPPSQEPLGKAWRNGFKFARSTAAAAIRADQTEGERDLHEERMDAYQFGKVD